MIYKILSYLSINFITLLLWLKGKSKKHDAMLTIGGKYYTGKTTLRHCHFCGARGVPIVFEVDASFLHGAVFDLSKKGMRIYMLSTIKSMVAQKMKPEIINFCMREEL